MKSASRKQGRCRLRRRGVVAVQVGVLMVAMVGFAALSVDVGAMYNAKADLQRTADAAALAAAGRLANYDGGNPLLLAKETASHIGQKNEVLGQYMKIDPDADVIFGRAKLNGDTGQYDFTPTTKMPDAVRVRVRKTAESPNGALTLYFARVLGFHEANLQAEAIAVLVPRDISVVADLSASHNDDSELKNYRYLDVNIYDVWNELPGGADEVVTTWNLDGIPGEWIQPDGSIPQAAGPGWGFMQELGWGTEKLDESYDPTADEGLIALPYESNWSDAQLEGFLAEQGYIPSEISAIMESSYDASGAYPYRVAVAMGLAFWNSGHPGGLWEQRGVAPEKTGNANNWISNAETEWSAQVFERSMTTSSNYWLEYINNYMNKSYTELNQSNPGFQYRFGAKTFTNFLMERHSSNGQTPEFSQTPTQPMQAVKDAVTYMTSLISDLNTDDQLSLEVYGTTGRHEVNLTYDHDTVATRLNAMQSGHYDGWTNVGGGIQRAIEELTSERARGTSRKVIFLLTDGNANVSAGGDVGDFQGGAAHALAQAEAAAAQGIRIFAVSVGAGANQSLMQQIAEIGDGTHFHAAGTIDEYSAQLTDIFRSLGSSRTVELVQ